MTASIFSQIVLPISLMVIMLGMGLSLQVADFARVVKYPKAVVVGVVGQMLLLPAVGFLIAAWWLNEPMLAVGLVLLAACPGGTTSNLITHQARGDLALSVTLTAITSIVTIVTIPLVTALALSYFTNASDPQVSLPVPRMMLTLFLITLLPIGVGMILKRYFPNAAAFGEPKISAFGALFLALLIVVILHEQGDDLPRQLSMAGPAALALNVVMMVLGNLSARLFRLNDAQTTSITIEVGIQNSTLAILVATSVLAVPEMAVPAAMYSLAMYATSIALIVRRRRRLATAQQ